MIIKVGDKFTTAYLDGVVEWTVTNCRGYDMYDVVGQMSEDKNDTAHRVFCGDDIRNAINREQFWKARQNS